MPDPSSLPPFTGGQKGGLSSGEWLILLMICSAFCLYLGMAIGGSLLQRSLHGSGFIPHPSSLIPSADAHP